MQVNIPQEIKAGQTECIGCRISASNAEPGEVYDDVKVSTDGDISLRYIQNSAKLTTHFIQDIQMPFEEMINNGTAIGSYGLDGIVPGGSEYSGYVTYCFMAVDEKFSVEEGVRFQGQKEWSKDLRGVKAGAILEYRMIYTNIGNVSQKNVHMRDALPKGLTYVSGSAEMCNSILGKYVKLSQEADDHFLKTGWIKLGSYAPNSNVIVRYKMKVEDAEYMNCGYNSYTNIVSVVTDDGTKQDRVKVTVHKHCKQ